MRSPALTLVFSLLFLVASTRAQTVADQAAGTWIKRYTKAAMADVVHPYENGLVWDRDNGQGIVFQGHLGTYTALNTVWPAFGDVYNTNQTWYYTHASSRFAAAHPMDRPQKTCGAKTYYDECLNRLVVYGGAFHASDNGYYEVDPRGDTLVKEDKQGSGINHPRLPWTFDGAARQWYEMRSLLEGPPMTNDWWGYNTNWAYVKEYGTGVLMAGNGPKVYLYCAHANAWSGINTINAAQGLDNVTANMPAVAYDRRNRKVVAVYMTATHLFDLSTRSWQKLTPSPCPTTAYHGTGDQWYEGYACMTYDANSDRCVFLRDDGAETWSFNTAAGTWTQETATGRPPNAGSMGEGLAYDPENNISVLFSNRNDEIWTYRHAATDPSRLNEAVNIAAVTTADSVSVSWSAPAAGPAPDRYHIYRAAWTDHATSLTSIEPGPYVLIDSTAGLSFRDAPARTARTFYSYSVLPVKAGGLTGLMSDPAFSRRPAPLGLIATVFSRTRVGLKWAADTASDVAGYNVYRKKGGVPRYNELVKLNSAPIGPRPVFIDSALAINGDTIFNYVVTTVNLYGQESGLSNRADTRAGRVMGVWFDTTTNTLSWYPTLCDTFREYQVWVQPIGTFEGGVAAFQRAFANIHDTFKVVGRQWHYKVRVVNAIGQSGHFSDLMPVATLYDNVGMYLGDGMLQKPPRDPFWDRLGLAPDEVALERGKRTDYTQPAALEILTAPNPFSGSTRITVRALAKAEFAGVFDIRGRLVQDLTPELRDRHEAQWSPAGKGKGVYVVLLRAGKSVKTAKIAFIP